eukprot:m.314130 g.314130  ORF g.314130 m.314130 type:complete len:313 (-) comp20263_c1_seq7:90-1028(-)
MEIEVDKDCSNTSVQGSAIERMEFMKREHEKTLASLHMEVRLLQEKNSSMSFKLLMAQQASDDLVIANDRIRQLEDERDLMLNRQKELEVMLDLAQNENSELRLDRNTACAQVETLQRQVDASSRKERELLEHFKSLAHAPCSPPAVKGVYREHVNDTSHRSSDTSDQAQIARAHPSSQNDGASTGDNKRAPQHMPSPPRRPPHTEERGRRDRVRGKLSIRRASLVDHHQARAHEMEVDAAGATDGGRARSPARSVSGEHAACALDGDSGMAERDGSASSGLPGGGGAVVVTGQLPQYPDPVPPIGKTGGPC